MMRRLMFFLLIVLFVFPLTLSFAIDWGGSVTSIATQQSVDEGSDDDEFTTNHRFVLYLNSPLGRRWSFVSQGAGTLDAESVFAADIEKLYFQRTRDFVNDEKYQEGNRDQLPNLIDMTTRFGRFSLTDATGLVLSHAVDGINVDFNNRGSQISLGAGYTGFINKEFSSVALSIRDSVDIADDETLFGPRRLLGRGTVRFPELMFNQNVTFGFAFQQDLRDPTDVVEPLTDGNDVEQQDRGGLVDTQYAIARLDGPLPTGPVSSFYSLTYIYNTGRTMGLLPDENAVSGESYQYSPIKGQLIRGQVNVFLPRLMSTSVTAGVLYSSGDDDYENFVEGNTEGDATMFTAVTPLGKGVVFGLEPGNTMTSEIQLSVKPLSGFDSPVLQSLQAQLGYYNFYRTAATGPVSAASVDATTDGSSLGSEIDFVLRIRPFSDLGIGLTTGFFFGNEDVLFDDANSFDYVVRLNASLSF